MTLIARPQSDEYAPFYAGYIQRVPDDADVFEVLSSQPSELQALLGDLSNERASAYPAEGEWSVKEMMGHICDTERIFSYRAVRVARGDTTPLPGFDQNSYVQATDFNARSLSDLLEEFALQRRANVLCLKKLGDAEILRSGTASNAPVTARALLYMMAGHVLHHIESLKTDYGIS